MFAPLLQTVYAIEKLLAGFNVQPEIGLIDYFISVSQISKLNKTAQSDVKQTHKIYI